MADNRIYFGSQPLLPVDRRPAPQSGRHAAAGAGSFAGILAAEEKKVSFSRHAIARLEERNLMLSDRDLERLDSAVERMAAKGARESLVYMGDVALVVSVTNRKVITAMDGASAKDNIFTNIDSAAIL